MKEDISSICKEMNEKWVKTRRYLHKYPEIATKEEKTSDFVYDYLKKLGLEVTDIYNTGVVAVLRGKGKGKTIAIRSDMDALIVKEETGASYRSEHEGYMHACGHDVHMASVLAAADILSRMRDSLNGNVKFIFQPSEENGSGAKNLIEQGVLSNPKVDAIIGGHVWPGIKTGTVEIVTGPVMAAPDEFEITILGKGGHGSQPELTVDPIVTSAQVILAIQTLVSRINDPLKPLVITIGSINGGSSYNIIPNDVKMKGTVRTLNMDLREKIPMQLKRCIDGITQSMGASFKFKYKTKHGIVINNKKMTKLAIKAAHKVIGDENTIESTRPTMVGEDFACYSEKIPGVFIRIGVTSDEATAYPLHNSKFNVDERSIAVSAAVYSQLVIDYFNDK